MNDKILQKIKFNKILNNKDELKIWEKLDNGCYIGTLGYSPRNIKILLKLLKSFEEQYGEVIDYEAARKELELYEKHGKLFIYFDQNMNPVSMNGCIFNYDNETIDFKSYNNRKINSLYFYGLSTIHEYRGKGACRALINYAIKFAYYNNFDLVYARTDLVGSNSEWLMKKAGLEVCTEDDYIIAEWVDVTEEVGDYRLHMWLPLKNDVYFNPKNNYYYAFNDSERRIQHKRNNKLILNKINA